MSEAKTPTFTLVERSNTGAILVAFLIGAVLVAATAYLLGRNYLPDSDE